MAAEELRVSAVDTSSRRRIVMLIAAILGFIISLAWLFVRSATQDQQYYLSAEDRVRNANIGVAPRTPVPSTDEDAGAPASTNTAPPLTPMPTFATAEDNPQAVPQARPSVLEVNQQSSTTALPAAPSCLTTTPGARGTPFPCATRITKFNGHAFWAWDGAEERRKQTVLAPVLDRCREVSSSPAAMSRDRPTANLTALGCSGYSGMWNRCWIVPVQGDGRPTCAAGDHFDIRIQNADNKVAIDRVIDLDNGIYELQFYIRKRGTYEIAVDKMILHQSIPPEVNAIRLTTAEGNRSAVGLTVTRAFMASLPPPVAAATTTPSWPQNVEYFAGSYESGVDVVPLNQFCDAVDDPDRFRFGAWHHVKECDMVHCGGSLRAMSRLEGWVWVSDVCIMRLYSLDEMYEMLAESWIVGWGGSTMKQPMSNFVEYYLRKPIFRVFMEHLDSLKKLKRRPGFFSYRQWDIRPLNSTRISMQWGGCPNLVAGPQGCKETVGAGNFAKIQGLVGPPPTTADAPQQVPSFPTLLTMALTVWRYPQDDDPAYFAITDKLFRSIKEWIASTKPQRNPLLIWHTSPASGNSFRGPRPSTVPFLFTTTIRNFNWFAEDHMQRHRNDVVIISRHTITLPLHHGIEWVHFGLHYGASEGMCNTGHERRGYEFANCVCKTWGDDAVILAWLNAYRRHRSKGSG